MLEKLFQRNKGSLIATLLLLVAVLASVQLVFLTYSQNLNLHKRYLSSVQSAMDLETARDLCLWEIRQAGNSWDTNTTDATYDSTPRFPGATIDTYGFYSIPGYNFRAKVKNEGGAISIYIHAFQGQAPNYKYSKYAEYTYAPIPLYQYYIFSNTGLTFFDGLVDCAGGRIHSNKDIILYPIGTGFYPGVIFNNLTEMTANGTIAYVKRNLYPPPSAVDSLDAYDEDHDGTINATEWDDAINTTPGLNHRGNMAPAPYAQSLANTFNYFTTGGQNVTPGPFRSPPSSYPRQRPWGDTGSGLDLGGCTNYTWENISSSVNAPLLWRGEETIFTGKQYDGAQYLWNPLGFYTTDETVVQYLSASGSTSNTSSWGVNAAKTYKFSVSGNSLNLASSTDGSYYCANAMFKPFKTSSGQLNSNEWFEIPGALPQTYPWNWTEKYLQHVDNNIRHVKFYVTEQCIGNTTAGCVIESPEPWNATGKGWRYIKYNSILGNCIANATGNTCYNDTNSVYVPAENFTYSGTPYFNVINAPAHDRNEEVLADSNYTYGDDYLNDSYPAQQIDAFSTAKQPNGLQQYFAQLELKGYGKIINTVPRREFNVGQLFNSATQESRYCTRAKQNGIYIDTNGTAYLYYGQSNQQVLFFPVATTWTFYNWRTSRQIWYKEINISALKTKLQNEGLSFNGIIYSQYPVMLSSATSLPGTNAAGKTAVFTVLSEQSVFLKGDYNTNTTDWKISHIATKKKIYALSNAFNNPSSPPDFQGYHGYGATANIQPWDSYSFVYVQRNATDFVYPTAEGNATLGNGEYCYPIHINCMQFQGGCGPYDYSYVLCLNSSTAQYDTVSGSVRDFVVNQRYAKLANWTGKNPPDKVDKNEYNYNSLLIAPLHYYDPFWPSTADQFLSGEMESWTSTNWYCDGYQCYYLPAKINATGAFINLYDRFDPNLNDAYYNNLTLEEMPFNNRTVHPNPAPFFYDYQAPQSPTLTLNYDPRFPNAVPKNYEAVLGVTGGEALYRQITEAYFNLSTQ